MVRRTPGDTLALKYLGELYVRYDMFEAGFTLFTRYDSLTDNRGRQLYFYLRERFDRRSYGDALALADYLIRAYPQSPTALLARFYRARALVGLGRRDEALREFHDIRAHSPVPGDRCEAAFRLGELYYETPGKGDSAREMYTLAAQCPNVSVWHDAQFALIRLEVRDGNLVNARVKLALAKTLAPGGDNLERLEYYDARLWLFADARDSAGVGFKRVIERYPQGLYVNDALEATLVLQQAGEASPELAPLYSSIEYLDERGALDSLRLALIALAEHTDTTLADVAFLRLGKLDLIAGDTTSALRSFSAVGERFPESYFSPYATKLKGDIYFNDPGRRTEALAIYRALLKSYEGYPFAAELRRKLIEAGQTPTPAAGKSST